jgi:hypothetical protein
MGNAFTAHVETKLAHCAIQKNIYLRPFWACGPGLVCTNRDLDLRLNREQQALTI